MRGDGVQSLRDQSRWKQVHRIRSLEPTGLLKLAEAQIHQKPRSTRSKPTPSSTSSKKQIGHPALATSVLKCGDYAVY
jgi:hypothetical protein